MGELPKAQQVKLLRAIQVKQVRPVGADRAEKIDGRIVCATHRHLYCDVHRGRFREDLFHRIAVGVLKLPALRNREGDLSLIIDHMLEELCDEATSISVSVSLMNFPNPLLTSVTMVRMSPMRL